MQFLTHHQKTYDQDLICTPTLLFEKAERLTHPPGVSVVVWTDLNSKH